MIGVPAHSWTKSKTPASLTCARFRFYGELNDFLIPLRRHRTFEHTVRGRPSIKDTVEALGVPHTEIGAIFANGRPVNFSYQPREKDCVRVYPEGRATKGKTSRALRAAYGLRPRFVLDSHLGKLARHLRLLGYDTVYKTVFPDDEIIARGVKEKRIILTRDIGLLKNKNIVHGRWVRSPFPDKQFREVLKKFRLAQAMRPLKLCLECNGRVRRIAKKKIFGRLPPKTRLYYQRFYECGSCKKIYWRGSHYERLMKIIRKARRIGTSVERKAFSG